jgi:hypothetical protein
MRSDVTIGRIVLVSGCALHRDGSKRAKVKSSEVQKERRRNVYLKSA